MKRLFSALFIFGISALMCISCSENKEEKNTKLNISETSSDIITEAESEKNTVTSVSFTEYRSDTAWTSVSVVSSDVRESDVITSLTDSENNFINSIIYENNNIADELHNYEETEFIKMENDNVIITENVTYKHEETVSEEIFVTVKNSSSVTEKEKSDFKAVTDENGEIKLPAVYFGDYS